MNNTVIYRQIGKDRLYKTWHASEENLLMFIYSDGGSIVCGEKIFPIKKGALVFIAADTYHYTMPDEPEKYERSKLIFSTVVLSKIIEILGEGTISHTLGNAIVYAEINECNHETVDRIFSEGKFFEKKSANELFFLSSLLRILFFLDRYAVESTSIPSGIISSAIKYINENISSDIGIEEICHNINVSKYYFCRMFKKQTGMSVMNYVLKTRIMLAKGELKKTNLSITEISEKFGFSSVSYFCRVFKEEENCSPLQYRKRNSEKIKALSV